MLVAAGACGAVAAGVQNGLSGSLGRAATLPLAIGMGVAAYALAGLLLRVPEARDSAARLARRARRRSSSGGA